MKPGDQVKCGHCNYGHFLVEANGYNNCVFCSCRAAYMMPAKEGDMPIGCTLQPINISAVKKEKREV